MSGGGYNFGNGFFSDEISTTSFPEYPLVPGVNTDFPKFEEILSLEHPHFGLPPETGFSGLHISEGRVGPAHPRAAGQGRYRFEVQNAPDAWQVGDAYLRCSTGGNDGRDVYVALVNPDVRTAELADLNFSVRTVLERVESSRADCYADRRYEADSPDDPRYKEAAKEKNFFKMLKPEQVRTARVRDYDARPWEEVPDVFDEASRDKAFGNERRLRLSVRFKVPVSSIAKKGGEQKPTCTEYRLRFDITNKEGFFCQLSTPPFIVVPHRKYIPFGPRLRRMKVEADGNSSSGYSTSSPAASTGVYSPGEPSPASTGSPGPPHDLSAPRKRAAAAPVAEPDDGGEWLVDFTDGTAPVRISLPPNATLADVRRAMEDCGYSTSFVRFRPVLSAESAQLSLEHVISVSKLYQGSRTISCDVNFLYLWEGRQEVPVEEVYNNLANCFGQQAHPEETLAQLRAFCAGIAGSNTQKAKFTKEKFQLFTKFFGADLSKCLYRLNEVYSLSYFHGFLDSAKAKVLLIKAGVGSYLVRFSQTNINDGLLALSVHVRKKNGTTDVLSILFKFDAVHNRWTNKEGTECFNHINDLVSIDKLRLEHPVARPSSKEKGPDYVYSFGYLAKQQTTSDS